MGDAVEFLSRSQILQQFGENDITNYAYGMRPIHPGEILREEYLEPLAMSVNALSKALHVPATRMNEIVRENRGG